MLVNYRARHPLGDGDARGTRLLAAEADRYLDFHEQMFAQGGVRDAEMALAIATKLGRIATG